jgi:hypothetical protein
MYHTQNAIGRMMGVACGNSVVVVGCFPDAAIGVSGATCAEQPSPRSSRACGYNQSTSGNDHPLNTFVGICVLLRAVVTRHFKSRVIPPALNVTQLAPPHSIQNFKHLLQIQQYYSKFAHNWATAAFVTNLNIRKFLMPISVVCQSAGQSL